MEDQNPADKVVSDIRHDFIAVGKHHVHGWYAWAIVGIVAGMLGGLLYVANWQGQFDASKAAPTPASSPICPFTATPKILGSAKGKSIILTMAEYKVWIANHGRKNPSILSMQNQLLYDAADAKIEAVNGEMLDYCKAQIKEKFDLELAKCDTKLCSLTVTPSEVDDFCTAEIKWTKIDTGYDYRITYTSKDQSIKLACSLSSKPIVKDEDVPKPVPPDSE